MDSFFIRPSLPCIKPCPHPETPCPQFMIHGLCYEPKMRLLTRCNLSTFVRLEKKADPELQNNVFIRLNPGLFGVFFYQ